MYRDWACSYSGKGEDDGDDDSFTHKLFMR